MKAHSYHAHLSRDGINVATFNQESDARELKASLESEGIESWVQDERRLQRYWFISHPQAGIHVRVPENYTALAQQHLESNPRAAAILEKAVRCPSCQSTRVEYPAITRKNVLPSLVAQVPVLLGFARHRCYCETCHYTWIPD